MLYTIFIAITFKWHTFLSKHFIQFYYFLFRGGPLLWPKIHMLFYDFLELPRKARRNRHINTPFPQCHKVIHINIFHSHKIFHRKNKNCRQKVTGTSLWFEIYIYIYVIWRNFVLFTKEFQEILILGSRICPVLVKKTYVKILFSNVIWWKYQNTKKPLTHFKLNIKVK